MSLPERKPNRLKNFDYSSVNYYFVTLCAKNKKHYFGKIENGQPILNKIGKLLNETWLNLGSIFSGITLDSSVVVPNHFHGIIIFEKEPAYRNAGKPATLGKIMGALKSKTNVLARKNIFPQLEKLELWQKTFYDRVIRNGTELLKIREYIENNPLKWEPDEYYRSPARAGLGRPFPEGGRLKAAPTQTDNPLL